MFLSFVSGDECVDVTTRHTSVTWVACVVPLYVSSRPTTQRHTGTNQVKYKQLTNMFRLMH